MRKITQVIVHCADTPESMDIGVKEIRRWHVEDNGWSDIGYHYVIRRNGAVENGRDIDTPGAHCSGYNKDSIGICLVGGKGRDGKPENNFTDGQLNALLALLRGYLVDGVGLYGHRDLNPGKACPCFDVRAWYDRVRD